MLKSTAIARNKMIFLVLVFEEIKTAATNEMMLATKICLRPFMQEIQMLQANKIKEKEILSEYFTMTSAKKKIVMTPKTISKSCGSVEIIFSNAVMNKYPSSTRGTVSLNAFFTWGPIC